MQKAFRKTLLIAILLLVPFVVFCVFFLTGAYSILGQETSTHLQEIVERGASKNSSIILDKFQLMHTLADEILVDPNISHDEKIEKLKNVAQNNGLLRMGVSGADGVVETTDRQYFNISDREYFMASTKGQDAISFVAKDRAADNDGEQIWVFSVPIRDEGAMNGVLFATLRVEEVRAALGIDFFGGQGKAYVVENNGSIVLSPDKKENGLDLFDILKSGETTTAGVAEVTKLEDALSQNDIGAFQLKIGGENIYFAFSPIHGVNNGNLNVLYSISTNTIFGGATNVLLYTMLFCLALLAAFICLIVFITNNQKKANRILYETAYVDKLTGLYNYKKFCLAHEAAASNEHIAVLYFDVNHFRVINDTFGYDFGDYLLCVIARILRESLVMEEPFARISDDKFIFSIKNDNRNELAAMAHKINARVNEEIASEDNIVHVYLSFGIYVPESADEDIKKMVDKANLARKSIKDRREEIFTFFEGTMQRQVAQEAVLQSEMERALEQRQFDVYYQPQIDFKSKKICGMEALVRWKNPQKGFISPAEFIPLAEKCGLIREIDRFVFSRVCQDLNGWAHYGLTLPVCVNISRTELYQPRFIERLQEQVSKYGLQESQFSLELTETDVSTDFDFVMEMARNFKACGFRVAMDDFGTGSSSLTCLKNLSFDILKLDRSFLRDLSSDQKAASIISSMITLAKSLDLCVVSEGVETLGEADFLTSVGCDIAQGFYFARPMPSEEFEKFAFHSEYSTQGDS